MNTNEPDLSDAKMAAGLCDGSFDKQNNICANGKIPNKRHNKSACFSEPVPKLFWTLEETATKLGLSVRTFKDLRDKHPLYHHDGHRNIDDAPKKGMPLWSEELVRLIAFARSFTVQGVRQLTDDDALKVRNGMGDKRRNEYLAFVES